MKYLICSISSNYNGLVLFVNSILAIKNIQEIITERPGQFMDYGHLLPQAKHKDVKNQNSEPIISSIHEKQRRIQRLFYNKHGLDFIIHHRVLERMISTKNSHEWNKHGVCWDEKDDLVPQTNGLTPQEEYFQTALALWKTYNIYDILFNAQIKPDASKNYYTDDIKAALKSQLKTDVQLLCTKDNNNQLFIQSVSFCLSEQYKPIVCACPVFGGIPCGKYKNDKVRYPPFNL